MTSASRPTDLDRAVTLFARLEADCLNRGAAALLPYLGMARCELVDYGAIAASIDGDLAYPGFGAALDSLEDLLRQMRAESLSLTETLRLDRTLELVLEGRELI